MAPHPVPDTAPTAAARTRSRPSHSSPPPSTPPPHETELIDTLRAFEDTKAALAAAQATLALRLDHTVRARHAAARIPAAQQGRDVAGLLAYARRESPAKGARLLGLARALTEQPHTHAAMAAGALSEWRATLITRETSCLSREDRGIVDTQISAPGPDGSYRFDSWGDRRLVAETQKLVFALDPAAVVNRRSQSRSRPPRHHATRTRHHGPDLRPRSPPPKASPSGPPSPRIADQARAAGDPRTRGQVMADTLVERITGLEPRRHRSRHHQRRDLRPGPPRRRPPTRLAPGLRTHPRRHHPRPTR